MEELQNLGMQLDSAADNADAITRGHCRTEHQELTDRERVIQQEFAERQQALTSHIDKWRRFKQQWKSVCAVLDEVESKLPERVDIACDVPVLRQQLIDCQDADDKLQSEMAHINDVIELGQQLLQHISSPRVRSQVDHLSDRIHCDSQKTDSSIQWYFLFYEL